MSDDLVERYNADPASPFLNNMIVKFISDQGIRNYVGNPSGLAALIQETTQNPQAALSKLQEHLAKNELSIEDYAMDQDNSGLYQPRERPTGTKGPLKAEDFKQVQDHVKTLSDFKAGKITESEMKGKMGTWAPKDNQMSDIGSKDMAALIEGVNLASGIKFAPDGVGYAPGSGSGGRSLG